MAANGMGLEVAGPGGHRAAHGSPSFIIRKVAARFHGRAASAETAQSLSENGAPASRWLCPASCRAPFPGMGSGDREKRVCHSGRKGTKTWSAMASRHNRTSMHAASPLEPTIWTARTRVNGESGRQHPSTISSTKFPQPLGRGSMKAASRYKRNGNRMIRKSRLPHLMRCRLKYQSGTPINAVGTRWRAQATRNFNSWSQMQNRMRPMNASARVTAMLWCVFMTGNFGVSGGGGGVI